MDARDVDVDRDDPVRCGQGRVGGRPAAGLPVPDVVVRLLRPAVRAEDRRVGLQGLERVHDHGQRLVVHVHRLDRVRGLVARLGDDGGDLLRLVHDRVDRQHHLLVAGEGRHPVEPGLLEVLAGDHRQDAGHRQGLARVDRLDRRVGVRAADDVHPDHVRQDDVLDVLAGAANEAGGFLSLLRMAHAPDFGSGLQLRLGGHLSAPRHFAASAARSSPAACWMALTMFT